MGIFDRIILTLYTIALTVISAAFVALATGWLMPLNYIETVLSDINGRWVVGLAGSAFFVASVRLLYFAFRRSGGSRSIVHRSELGEVRVSLEAVENLVTRVAVLKPGVKDVRASAGATNGKVTVNLRIRVSPDTSIPQLSDELQREVARQVRNVIGVEVAQVRLHVTSITTDNKRGRVE